MMRMRGKFGLLGYGLGNGQRETEHGSAARRFVHPNALSVRFDEGLGDGEPEPGAGIVVSAGEQLEALISSLGADARAVIGDRYLDAGLGGESGANRDRCGLRAVSERVLQEVRQHPGDEHEVSVDGWQVVSDLGTDDMAAWGQIVDDTSDEIAERCDRVAGLENSGLDTAHVEEILHEVGESVGLDIDELGEPAGSLR